MAQAELPTFGKKKHKRQQLPAILQPTQKRPRCTASASERASSSAPSDGLKSILSKLGFVSFWPLFVREQVNVSIVASWDLAAMKAYFPDYQPDQPHRFCERADRTSDPQRHYSFDPAHVMRNAQIVGPLRLKLCRRLILRPRAT